MAVGTIVNQFADEFPKVTRAGSGPGKQRTDVDVALEQLKAQFDETGAPSKALLVIDYKQGVDEAGNPVPVDPKTAATRAQARVQGQRKRGYTKADGWKLAAINGELWAQYFGPGGLPTTNGQSEGAETAAA